jgi:hypothetical protein
MADTKPGDLHHWRRCAQNVIRGRGHLVMMMIHENSKWLLLAV